MNETVTAIRIEAFDYPLPDEMIAKYPLPERDQSKLLISKRGTLTEDQFFRLGDHLPGDALLVSNETRVIHARLLFRKPGGALIELFCLEPVGAISDFQLAFSSPSPVHWQCLVGNSKRWKGGRLESRVFVGETPVVLTAERICNKGSYSEIAFSWSVPEFPFAQLLESAGQVPLPPYLNRPPEAIDNTRYQTVFAKHDGSVAAPTAGLHFTGPVIEQLKTKGMQFAQVTLHVGAGTFRPVTSTHIGAHEMHAEHIVVAKQTIRQLMNHDGPVIAIGTTSMRTLESLYWIGLMLEHDKAFRELHLSQWFPYDHDPEHLAEPATALNHILDYLETHQLDQLTASTAIMIAPGYPFRVVKGLITNFHQPKSTLLLLVSALIGERWREAYAYALNNKFRFLSYGDSCLFMP